LAFRRLRAPSSSAHATREGRRRLGRLSVSSLIALGLTLATTGVATAAWPVADRHDSYISQPYHKGHRADDIAAPRGDRIMPIRSGRVIFAGWRSNCGGYQVWVSHGNGLYSAYYHMRRETSWKGRVVYKSTSTLGYVGATGCATGPHVHLEVWRGYPWRSGSYRINPWSFIDGGTYFPLRYL
jgi:murein DD-endopeptidase MepM/ murein hydrolase activator NlpD